MPRRIKRRRRRGRRTANILPYSWRKAPQRYGPGKTFLSLNKEDIEINGSGEFNIGNFILNSSEFILQKYLYQYFKIMWIKIIFPPINTNARNTGSFAVTWFDEEIDANTADSAKIIPKFSTKPTTYTFKPPNLTIYRDIGNVYNPSEFIRTNIGNLWGKMEYATRGEFIFTVGIHILIKFRSAVTFTPSSLIAELQDKESFRGNLYKKFIKTKELPKIKEEDNEEEKDAEEEKNKNIENEIKNYIRDKDWLLEEYKIKKKK